MADAPHDLSRFAREFLEQHAPDGLLDLSRSEQQDEDLQSWWERHHAEETTVWRSPSNRGETVWARLGVSPRPGDVVLNIGVGSGRCTRDLSDVGCEVHAMDISTVALARVGDIARIYRPGEPLPAVDLALSHLVAQHMTDDELRTQIAQVVAALKPGGVFAMQFAVADDPTVNSRASAKGGGVTRSPARMAALAEEAGAEVAAQFDRESYPQFGVSWSVIHLRSRAKADQQR